MQKLLCLLAFSAACVSCAQPAATPEPLVAPAAATRPRTRAANAAADSPSPRKLSNGKSDAAWLEQHAKNVARAQAGGIDLYFTGDATLQRWTSTGKAVWQEEFAARHAVDFAIPGDKTEHLLWRLQHGELDGISPKIIVVMIGANNHEAPEQTAGGIAAILRTIHEKSPASHVLVLSILARGNAADPARRSSAAVNALLPKITREAGASFKDLTPLFTQADGSLKSELFAPDHTYLTEKGYQELADALRPALEASLVPPSPGKETR